ncbi:hypothetical protein HHK36_018757 [Tetracentron sinense]|uniref:Uncharacterized protein n=1 Tax=Tetracentron sinense TaxID=13715 RepID=A0A834YZZ6_TETSI|nr:hypothetical protein HHK36_018757 [Tetracentron sinense]
MGDLATLAKARLELEELYLGVPDESVNLTFQDLADVKQNAVAEKKKAHMEPIHEVNTKEGFVIGRLPSLDFSKGLEAAAGYHHHHHVEGKGKDSTRGFPYQYHVEREGMHASRGHNGHVDHDHANPSNSRRNTGFRTPTDTSLAYDDVSGISIASKSPYQERGGRRRSGIPHSNICTICSVYIYIFRHRCLVHTKSRNDRVLLEVSKYGEAARAQVGREGASEER